MGNKISLQIFYIHVACHSFAGVFNLSDFAETGCVIAIIITLPIHVCAATDHIKSGSCSCGTIPLFSSI